MYKGDEKVFMRQCVCERERCAVVHVCFGTC